MFNYGILILSIILFLTNCAGTSKKTTVPNDSKIIPPVLLDKPDFYYPKEAQDRGIEGIVDIYVYINKNGEVTDSKIANSSNFDQLDEAAIAYVMEMKFKPAQKDNQTIGVWLKYEINYTFSDGSEKFEIKDYLSHLEQYLNYAAEVSGDDRDNAIKMILELHQGYANYVQKHPTINYNQTIAKQFVPTTIKRWGKFFDLWPLTFVLYDDLTFRFRDSNYITLIRNQMLNLMYDDLIRIEKIDQGKTINRQKSVEFAKEVKSYLNNNFQSEVPDFLTRELERLITLY